MLIIYYIYIYIYIYIYTKFSALPDFPYKKLRTDIFKKCSIKLSMGVQYEVICRKIFEDIWVFQIKPFTPKNC